MSSATTGPGAATGGRRRVWPLRAAVVAVLLGLVVVSDYNILATYYNTWHAYRQASPPVVDTLPDEISSRWLDRARAYNQHLGPGLLADPWNTLDGADVTASSQYRDYRGQLARTEVMARLRIPAIRTTLPVYHGTSDSALAHGAGHVFGTSLPVGGPGTHAAVAAHRGEPDFQGFDKLPDLAAGDEVLVDVEGLTLAYRIDDIRTVLPDAIGSLAVRGREDRLTLVTCTPYGVNTHRLLVSGHRIPLEQASTRGEPPRFDWRPQPWMTTGLYVGLALLLAVLLLAVTWTVQAVRGRSRRRQDGSPQEGRP